MKRVLALSAVAAVVLLGGVVPAFAETCVLWGPTVDPVPQGACLPV